MQTQALLPGPCALLPQRQRRSEDRHCVFYFSHSFLSALNSRPFDLF